MAVRGRLYRVPGDAEYVAQQVADILLVVDYQDFFTRVKRPGGQQTPPTEILTEF
jgi:chemotaxis regulatin CheY-phosphate phosphatase CheZ